MKVISIELKKEFMKDIMQFNIGQTEIEKETNTLYKIGNQGLLFDCYSQIKKDDITKIYYSNFEKRNDRCSDSISVKVFDICTEEQINDKIKEWKQKLIQYAKDELNNRMESLISLQKEVEALN